MKIQEAREQLKALAGHDGMTPADQEGLIRAMHALEEAVLDVVEEGLDEGTVEDWTLSAHAAISRIRADHEPPTT